MLNRFHDKPRSFIAGVQNPSENQNLINSALAFSQRTEMSLKFTHVVDEDLSEQRMHHDDRIRVATDALKQLLSRTNTSSSYDIEVLSGLASDAILVDARASSASFIMATYNPGDMKQTTPEQQSVLDLMASATIPVMVIPRGYEAFQKKGDLTILAADDLTETCSDVLDTALELAIAWGHSRVIHFHATDEMRGLSTSEKNSFSQKGKRMQKDDSFTLNYEQELRKKMASRLRSHAADLVPRQVTCQQKIAFGPTIATLHEAAGALRPDLMVFGRHQFMHQNPTTLGDVPLLSMLNLKIPVMVVAQIQHLQ